MHHLSNKKLCPMLLKTRIYNLVLPIVSMHRSGRVAAMLVEGNVTIVIVEET